MKRRRSSRARPSLTVDIVVASKRWGAVPQAEKVIRRAVAAAASAAATSNGEIAIVLTDDSSIRELNRQWRGKDQPTNVLSFPSAEPQPHTPVLLGDIVIAYETVAREALAEDKPFMHHLAHLAVHVFLHLVGYDHETDKEAKSMESLEVAVLGKLAVPDPYAARKSLTRKSLVRHPKG
jgi:probable rRNA maturation factor